MQQLTLLSLKLFGRAVPVLKHHMERRIIAYMMVIWLHASKYVIQGEHKTFTMAH